MGTKSWQIFDGKIRTLMQHLQLSDLALTLANNKANSLKDNGKSIGETLGAKTGKHLQLNIPNQPIDIKRTFVTSRNKLNEQALIDLYRIYSDYIRNIVAEVMHKKPQLLIELLKLSGSSSKESKSEKDHHAISCEDILKIGCYDSLIDEISRRLYRSLENERSDVKLLSKIIKTTHINIDETLKKNALLYLEIRHLIIHNNSMADEKFLKMPNVNLVKVNSQNKKICLNYDITNRAITEVFKLCKTLDDEFLNLIS